MFDGERRQMTADVRPNSAYSVEMICSNDGDPDKITLCADGNTIGEYITAENRLGGNGWYRDQTAGPYSFTSTSNGVNLEVRTRTDEWGTWPKELRISRIEWDYLGLKKKCLNESLSGNGFKGSLVPNILVL